MEKSTFFIHDSFGENRLILGIKWQVSTLFGWNVNFWIDFSYFMTRIQSSIILAKVQCFALKLIWGRKFSLRWTFIAGFSIRNSQKKLKNIFKFNSKPLKVKISMKIEFYSILNAFNKRCLLIPTNKIKILPPKILTSLILNKYSLFWVSTGENISPFISFQFKNLWFSAIYNTKCIGCSFK